MSATVQPTGIALMSELTYWKHTGQKESTALTLTSCYRAKLRKGALRRAFEYEPSELIG